MFLSPTAIMLYVDDVPAERAFREAISANIVNNEEAMGSPSFTFTPNAGGTHFTIYTKELIRQIFPEVASNAPRVLFTSDDLATLRARISEHTGDNCL